MKNLLEIKLRLNPSGLKNSSTKVFHFVCESFSCIAPCFNEDTKVVFNGIIPDELEENRLHDFSEKTKPYDCMKYSLAVDERNSQSGRLSIDLKYIVHIDILGYGKNRFAFFE